VRGRRRIDSFCCYILAKRLSWVALRFDCSHSWSNTPPTSLKSLWDWQERKGCKYTIPTSRRTGPIHTSSKSIIPLTSSSLNITETVELEGEAVKQRLAFLPLSANKSACKIPLQCDGSVIVSRTELRCSLRKLMKSVSWLLLIMSTLPYEWMGIQGQIFYFVQERIYFSYSVVGNSERTAKKKNNAPHWKLRQSLGWRDKM